MAAALTWQSFQRTCWQRLSKVSFKYFVGLSVFSLCVCLITSAFWNVPYILTLAAVAGVVFAMDLVSVDDELPGGFFNLDGEFPFPWKRLSVKGAVVAVFLFMSIVPEIRAIGG